MFDNIFSQGISEGKLTMIIGKPRQTGRSISMQDTIDVFKYYTHYTKMKDIKQKLDFLIEKC